ncbi:MAG: molybdenum cofactor guanylyltransferase, partial [Mycobacterium sp.]
VLPWDGRDHYLAGIYRTELAGRIDALVAGGARSMRALCDSVVTHRVVMAATKAQTNLNSESDLR